MYNRVDIVGAAAPRYALVGASDPDLRALMAMAGAAGDPGAAPSYDDAALIQARLAQAGVVVKESMPSKARRYPLGIDSGEDVVGGDTVTINSQPQLPFRIERLVVPSDIGGNFVIEDFIVGKTSQFANEAAVPARIFDERAEGVWLRGDTAQTSQNVVLKVTNTSGGAIRFRAAVIGTALDS